MPESESQKSKRLLKNTLFLYLRMLFVMGVGFFTSRVVLDKLGVVDYGIQNVVSGMATMFIFFRSSLANASQRFFCIAHSKNDVISAKSYFCQHQTLYVALAIIVVIFAETIGLWFVMNKLVIPPERLRAALWCYHFFIISLVLTLLSVVYDATLISHENMRIYSYVGVFEGVAKLIIAFLISIAPFDRLIFYAMLTTLVALIIRIFYGVYCKKHYVECRFRFTFDKQNIKETTAFISWNFIGTAVWSVNNQGIDILLNLFFGPVVNAAKAISSQVNGVITNFSSNFFVSVQPQITKSYTNGDYDYLMKLFYASSKYSFFLLWILCLPVILHTEILLSLWLKNVPEYSSIFTKLILGYSLINILANPPWSVALASGKLKKYICIGSFVFLMSFPIAYILLKNGMSPISVLISNIVVRFVYIWVVLLIIKKYIPLSITKYCKSVVFPIISVVILSGAMCLWINNFMKDEGALVSCILGLIDILISIACVFFIGLNKKERYTLYKNIKKRILGK